MPRGTPSSKSIPHHLSFMKDSLPTWGQRWQPQPNSLNVQPGAHYGRFPAAPQTSSHAPDSTLHSQGVYPPQECPRSVTPIGHDGHPRTENPSERTDPHSFTGTLSDFYPTYPHDDGSLYAHSDRFTTPFPQQIYSASNWCDAMPPTNPSVPPNTGESGGFTLAPQNTAYAGLSSSLSDPWRSYTSQPSEPNFMMGGGDFITSASLPYPIPVLPAYPRPLYQSSSPLTWSAPESYSTPLDGPHPRSARRRVSSTSQSHQRVKRKGKAEVLHSTEPISNTHDMVERPLAISGPVRSHRGRKGSSTDRRYTRYSPYRSATDDADRFQGPSFTDFMTESPSTYTIPLEDGGQYPQSHGAGRPELVPSSSYPSLYSPPSDMNSQLLLPPQAASSTPYSSQNAHSSSAYIGPSFPYRDTGPEH